jgi:hypothetical protein
MSKVASRVVAIGRVVVGSVFAAAIAMQVPIAPSADAVQHTRDGGSGSSMSCVNVGRYVGCFSGSLGEQIRAAIDMLPAPAHYR